jgi:tRNA A-37 threonylcarbamoyl transferase component Bud32
MPDGPANAGEAGLRLELAALTRLGLAGALASVPGLAPGEPLVDALVRAGALRPGQAIAVRAYVARNSVVCAQCRASALAPEGSASAIFSCPDCATPLLRAEPGPAVVARPPPVPTTGGRVGPLEIQEVLGRGAFGVVYKVRHAQLGRQGALKIVAGAGLDEQTRRRFEREVVAQARLDHPGIVKIHATWELQGALACEMELVEGETLAARLARGGALPWREAARIVALAARALDHAHRRGVLHRDLKPANILLRQEDGSPVVADLGLARFLDQASSLTRSGAAPGTPAYMAPEVLRGQSGPAVDVYGLGVVLHEALTGEPPFGNEPTLVGLLSKIAQGSCRPGVAPGAPPELERIRARAMSLEPEARHATPGALADDLERLLAGGDSGRRRPWLRVTASVLALVLAFAVLGLAVHARAPREPLAVAREKLEAAATAEPERAKALAVEAAALAPGDADTTIAAARILASAGAGPGARDLLRCFAGAEQPAQRAARVHLLRDLGDGEGALAAARGEGPLAVTLLLELGRPADALALARSLDARAAGAGAKGRARAETLVPVGESLLAVGELALAREAFLQARLQDGGSGAASAGLALVLLALGAPEDARKLAERAVLLAPTEAWGHYALAGSLLEGGDVVSAREELARAGTLWPSAHACLAGRALAADLAAGKPAAACGRAVVREARRSALVAIVTRAPEHLAEARRACDAAVAAFPASGSARTSLTAVHFLENDPRLVESAEQARALEPEDSFTGLVVGHALAQARGFPEARTIIDGAAKLEDREALASGIHSELVAPGVLAYFRAVFAQSAGDLAAARELARFAADHALTRGDRQAALSQLALAMESEKGPELEAIRREIGRLEPERAEGRAAARFDRAEHDVATFDAEIRREPWEPVWRMYRSKMHIVAIDFQLALRDQCAAAMDGSAYSIHALLPFLWADERALLQQHLSTNDLGGSRTTGPAQEILERIYAGPENVRFPEPASPVEAAGDDCARCLLALNAVAPDGASRARRAVQAVDYATRAEGARATAPVIHLLRSIALDRLDAPLAAARERGRFSAGVPPAVDACALAILSRIAQDRELPKLIDRTLSAQSASLTAAKRLPVEDLSGIHHAIERLTAGKVVPPVPATQSRILLPALSRASHGGWAVEEVEGELALTATGKTEPLEIIVEGDVIEAEVLTGPGLGPLVLEADGETYEVKLDARRFKGGRNMFVVAAGLPAGPQKIRLTSGGGKVTLFCVNVRSLAGEGSVEPSRRDLASLFERIARRSATPAELEAMLGRGDARREEAWRLAASELGREAQESAPRFVELCYERLLGREPTPEEKRLWVERLGHGFERAWFSRALARSAEFKE